MLGFQAAECERHIAWAIGGAVCCLIGDALGAVVIRQNYSRLAIDCDRTPGSETSIVEVSELTTVPGNIGLSKTQVEALIRENRRFNCGEAWRGANQAPAIDWRQFSAPVYIDQGAA
jgi:predicted N-formylglutamate amidohydrolase